MVEDSVAEDLGGLIRSASMAVHSISSAPPETNKIRRLWAGAQRRKNSHAANQPRRRPGGGRGGLCEADLCGAFAVASAHTQRGSLSLRN